MCWACPYVGFSEKIRVDKGSKFNFQRWIEIVSKLGIKIHVSGIESHNSLGSGERYHDPLRRIYNKIRYSEPTVEPQLALKLATKAMNDTINAEDLVPLLLVFGLLPRFPPINTDLPGQEERMRAMQVARAEMETITAELRLRRAFHAKLPAASKINLKIGQEVLVCREDAKPSK